MSEDEIKSKRNTKRIESVQTEDVKSKRPHLSMKEEPLPRKQNASKSGNEIQSRRNLVKVDIPNSALPNTKGSKLSKDELAMITESNALKSDIKSKRPTNNIKLLPVEELDVKEVISKRPQAAATKKVKVEEEIIFDHNVERKREKGMLNWAGKDPPSKENNYYDSRMSEVLRDYRGNGWDELITDKKEFEDEDRTRLQMYLQDSHEQKVKARSILATLSIIFLWATSVAACRMYIFLFIPSPSISDVTSSISRLSESALDERLGYFDCIQEEVESCQLKYRLDTENEGARLTAIQLSNSAIIDRSYNIRDNCRSSFQRSLDTIETLAPEQVFDFDRFIADESVAQCQQIRDIFQAALASVEAMNAADEIGGDSINVINEYESQFNERREYEENYHSNITTELEQRPEPLTSELYGSASLLLDLQNDIDIVRACLNLSTTFVNEFGNLVSCPPEKQVAKLGNDIYLSFERRYQRFEELMRTMKEFSDDIERIAGLVRGFLRFLRFFGIGVGFSRPNFDQLFSLFARGLNFLGISDEDLQRFIAARQAELDAALDAAGERLDRVKEDIINRTIEFAEDLRDEFLPNDLAEATIIAIAEALGASEELAQQIADDLSAVNTAINDFELDTPFEAIVDATAVDFLVGIADRTISFFSYGDDFFLDFASGLTVFLNWVMVLDILIRILQSIFLWKKYYNMTNYATPPAEVTSDKGTLFKARKNTLQKVATILSNPLMRMLYSLVIILCLSLLFYRAYEPLYLEFVDGCVENDHVSILEGQQSDGTMLFRNLNTMTAGFASSLGDIAIGQQVDRFNIERDIACSELLQSSVNIRQDHFDTHEDLRKSISMLGEDYELFDDCVDWPAVDDALVNEPALANLAISLFGAPVDFSFTEEFGNQTCKEPIEEIDVSIDALHDCAAIDICFAPENCGGPNFDNLARLNHNAACTSEFAMHSYTLVTLFALVIYICLNFARYYVIRGILRIKYDTFIPDMYSYMVTATEAGTIIPPDIIQRGEIGFVELRKKKLEGVLKKFRIKGMLDFFFAFCINLPWMVFVGLFTRELEFQEA